jgi:hypothetical protein
LEHFWGVAIRTAGMAADPKRDMLVSAWRAISFAAFLSCCCVRPVNLPKTWSLLKVMCRLGCYRGKADGVTGVAAVLEATELTAVLQLQLGDSGAQEGRARVRFSFP